MLRPVDRRGWHDPDPCFGVEFKNVRETGGIRGFTKWAAQAADYAHTTWDRGGRMVIFTCPPVTADIGWGGPEAGALMAHLLGQIQTSRVVHNCQVQGRSTGNQIDVLWDFTDAARHDDRIAFEARSYKSSIKQGALHAFRSVVDDIQDQARPGSGARTGNQHQSART